MRKFLTTACALVLSGAISVGALGAAQAQQFARPSVPAATQTTDGIVNVQFRDNYYDRGGSRYYRGDRHWRGDRGWRGDRYWRGDRRWDRGRYYRDRRGDALAAGAAGLVTGAIIGGIVANQQPRRVIRSGGGHTDWCYNRYRSYRASDNTYQPYNGPRRQCVSPY